MTGRKRASPGPRARRRGAEGKVGPSRAPSTTGTGLPRGCRKQVGWALRALPPWPLTPLGNVNGTNAPSWGLAGRRARPEKGGRVAFSFQTWCSHPSGADGTGRDLGIQAPGQRQFSHELTLTAQEPPGPLADLSTISLAPAGQSPNPTPRPSGRPEWAVMAARYNPEKPWGPGTGQRVRRLRSGGCGLQAGSRKDRWIGGMRRAGQHLPLSSGNERRAKDRDLGRCQH